MQYLLHRPLFIFVPYMYEDEELPPEVDAAITYHRMEDNNILRDIENNQKLIRVRIMIALRHTKSFFIA